MPSYRFPVNALLLSAALVLAGCAGQGGGIGSLGGLFGGGSAGQASVAPAEDVLPENATAGTPPPLGTLTVAQPAPRRGLFGRKAAASPDTTIQVNKYIWTAALDVLSFLPLQSADPFTGVIVTGYGTPPGGGRAYRATIFIQDAALEARSLKVALYTRSGPASAETVRAVEDAILARARQLRMSDRGL